MARVPETFAVIRDNHSNSVNKKCKNYIPTPGVIFQTNDEKVMARFDDSSVLMSTHSPKETKAKKILDHNAIQPKTDSPDASSL